MTAKPPFYITTPIYYVNDSPHIGHAYTTIAADVMARFMRLDGHKVYFLTGTDEHGQKVDKAAREAGIDPQEFTDNVSQRFRNLVQSGENTLNVTNDDFIRTTEERHKKAAQALWQRIEANGFIYKDTYGGWYAVRDEAYYQESELVEREGKKFAPTGAEAEWVEEESYFFKLSEFAEKLLKHYEDNPDFVVPANRMNEVKSFVKGGLKDLSISRTTFNWGIKVPSEQSTKHKAQSTSSHVMYVWIDALTNYLTAVDFPNTESQKFKDFWGTKEDPRAVHIIGKDILRFHAVYWPAFLMAADLPLPKQIIAHGWWTIEGEKMSKSLGNVLSPQDMIALSGSVDALRYFMLRAMPFGNDGDFSKERLVETINADLANNIGNLAQRTLSMIQKNCEGKVPECHKEALTDADKQVLHFGYVTDTKTPQAVWQHMANGAFHEILPGILKAATESNQYIDAQEPWKRKADNPARMQAILFHLAENVRCIAIMLQPFCPTAAAKLLDQLAIPLNQRSFSHLSADFALKPCTPLPPPQGIFPRIEK